MSSGKREQHAGERRVPGAGKAAAARLAAALALDASEAAAALAIDAALISARLELAGEDALAAAAAAAAAFWARRSRSDWARAAASLAMLLRVGMFILCLGILEAVE